MKPCDTLHLVVVRDGSDVAGEQPRWKEGLTSSVFSPKEGNDLRDMINNMRKYSITYRAATLHSRMTPEFFWAAVCLLLR